jgi:hypothetical protein
VGSLRHTIHLANTLRGYQQFNVDIDHVESTKADARLQA